MIEHLDTLNSIDFTSADVYAGVVIGVLLRNKAEAALRSAFPQRFSRKTTQTVKGKTDTQPEVDQRG